MKEYVELRSGLRDYVNIHTEDELIRTDFPWHTGSIKVINKFAKDGWKVVGYERYSILMERDSKNE
jgi:hypothetical protein